MLISPLTLIFNISETPESGRNSGQFQPENPCTLLDNTKKTRNFQAESRALLAEAYEICRQDYKDLHTGANRICRLDWIIFARNRGRSQGFHQNE